MNIIEVDHKSIRYTFVAVVTGTVALSKLGEAFNTALPMLDSEYKGGKTQDWARWLDVLLALYDCERFLRLLCATSMFLKRDESCELHRSCYAFIGAQHTSRDPYLLDYDDFLLFCLQRCDRNLEISSGAGEAERMIVLASSLRG